MENSVKGSKCGKWVHARCAKMNRVTTTLPTGFVREQCVKAIEESDKDIPIFDLVEFVKSFFYLRNRLNTSGGSEAAVTARMRIGWIKFREGGSCIMKKAFVKKMKGRIYQSCVR